MQTKGLVSPLSSSYRSPSFITAAAPAATAKSSPSVIVALNARRALLQERRARIAGCDERSSSSVSLTQGSAEQHLIEAARLAADLLELAEHADDAARRSTKRAPRAMRALADACFDAVLALDGARQDLCASIGADLGVQQKLRRGALRCARRALAQLDHHLARALAN